MEHARPLPCQANCAGVTLIQSLIAMAVLAILTGMALPAMQQTRDRLQADSLRMQLASALATARNTAITERRPIAVCPTDDGVTCARDWARGWMLYAPATPSSGEARSAGPLLVQQHARSRLSAWGSQAKPRLQFRPDGRLNGSNQSVIFCLDGASQGKVVVSLSGRIRSERPRRPVAC